MNPVKINNKYSLAAICLLALPLTSLAQDGEAVHTTSYFSNPLFNALVIVSLLLAAIIVALSSVLKNISNSDWILNKKQEGKSGNGINATGLILLFSLLSFGAFAQEPVKAIADDGRIGGIDQPTFYFVLSVIAIELIVIIVLLRTIKFILKTETERYETETAAAKRPKEKTILDKLSDAVDVEREGEIMLDHDYDGIKELDNNLPPWWKYGFYFTIIVGIIYLINYHVIKSSPLQGEEYKISVKQAEKEIAEYMKTSANNVDETTVKMLEAPDVAAGKDLFLANCAACHGKAGEGSVGPNLTDDYWLHGGSIQDVFKTIKYGWPDKGMKSWKEDFSPMQIAQLSSFIKTLRGTNPANGKPAQGDLYTEGGAAPASDSTAVSAADSLNLQAVADTLKK